MTDRDRLIELLEQANNRRTCLNYKITKEEAEKALEGMNNA